MTLLHKLPNAAGRSDAPSDETEMTLEGLDARTVSLFVIAFGVTVFLLQHMQALFAPLAFGLLLFYALDPVVDAMERIRVPRWIGAAITILLTFGTIGAGAYLLQDEAITVINRLPTAARRITALIERDARAYRNVAVILAAVCQRAPLSPEDAAVVRDALRNLLTAVGEPPPEAPCNPTGVVH